MDSELIEIDGSFGEAGGQIIRSSLTLSAITQKPVKIINIRAKRSKPGLQAQHLTACKAVRNVCRGTLENAELGSSELIFHPGEIVGGEYEFNIGTAGSVTLVAQTLLPILLFAKKESKIKIIGGTHVIRSPSYDYFEKIFLPAITRFGVEANAKIIKPGYYPRGGGEIEIEIKPKSKLNGCENWHPGNNIQALIRLSNLSMGIAIREKKIFVQNNIEDIRVFEDSALDPANAVLLWQGFKGAYVLGERGKRAEQVATEALEELKKQENAEVDYHLADQLLLYATLAEGKTTYTTSQITEHFRTNVEIIRKFINRKISIMENDIIIE